MIYQDSFEVFLDGDFYDVYAEVDNTAGEAFVEALSVSKRLENDEDEELDYDSKLFTALEEIIANEVNDYELGYSIA